MAPGVFFTLNSSNHYQSIGTSKGNETYFQLKLELRIKKNPKKHAALLLALSTEMTGTMMTRRMMIPTQQRLVCVREAIFIFV